MKRSKKGQSTLEYIIILAAVIGAIIAFASVLKSGLKDSYGNLNEKMSNKVSCVGF